MLFRKSKLPAARKPLIMLDLLGFDPAGGGFTTATKDLLNCCEVLSELDFVVVCTKSNASYLKNWPFKLIVLNFPKSAWFLFAPFLIPIVARREKVDAVHFEISAVTPWLSIPSSVTVHDLYFLTDKNVSGSGFKRKIMHYYWGKVYTRSLFRANIVKTISSSTTLEVHQRISASLPTRQIYPFSGKAQATSAPRKWPCKTEILRIIFVGSLVPRKNLGFLLNALAELDRPWSLDIVGRAKWNTEKKLPRLDWDQVTVHGYLSEDEKIRLHQLAHLTILPSLCEGFSYPAVEAISSGCLVLASNRFAFKEYVPEFCRFEINDIRNLIDIIENLHDQNYQTYLTESRENIEKFNWDNYVTNHRDFFANLIENLNLG